MKRINKIYLGVVYDALREMGQKLETFYIDIKPKFTNEQIIIGPALTTKGRKVNRRDNYIKLDKIRIEIYKKELFKNKPIILLQANDNKVAHAGDITCQIYKSLGAVGFITDGNVRDIDKCEEINFPVFCQKTNPIDAINYWALTEYQKNIIIKNVLIKPGDMIYASNDGVIRVKKSDFKKFKLKLNTIIKKENDVRKLIKSIKNKQDYKKPLLNFLKQKGRW
jgi:4-hydroxy-4-methyl-2-oxoglutarate aldolase